jgi:Putative DNA-binding domain
MTGRTPYRLADFQRQFQAGLMAGDLAVFGGRVARPAGLEVHAHAARAMLVDGLADNFAQTLHWLGGEVFTDLALDYIAITPSHSWTLAEYGADFPEYLGRRLPEDAEVAELAALDWALRGAFAAADPVPARWAEDGRIDWEAQRMKLAPGAALLAFATNADDIWAAIPSAPIGPVDAPGWVLVWRDGLEPRFRRMVRAEGTLLANIAAGQCFGVACNASGVSADVIGGWLHAWLNAGLVVPQTGLAE